MGKPATETLRRCRAAGSLYVRREGAAGRPECQRNGARERNCVYEVCPVLVGLRSANPELDLDLIVRIGYRKIYRAATVGKYCNCQPAG